MSRTTALFAGTFDPVTNGHVDIARRATHLFDQVVVSVSRVGRATLFPIEERVALVREALAGVAGVVVESFEGLVVEQARRHGAVAMVRGIRSFQDWDHEMQMAFANRRLYADLDTVFLPPSVGMTSVSSSLVREVSALGGDVSAWVPEVVVRALGARRERPSG